MRAPRARRAASQAAEEEDFEAVWRLYPRKVSKGAGRKAYAVARKKVSAETIERAVTGYAAQRTGQDEKYTKHFSSWLNGECWTDETPNNSKEIITHDIPTCGPPKPEEIEELLRAIRG
jgi:hypothetical protein